MRITRDTILRRNPDQLFSEIDEEVIMLSIENGEYYSLDITGSYIWKMLNTPCTFQYLICNLLATYEVSEETCINETRPFLEESLNKGLIEIINE